MICSVGDFSVFGEYLGFGQEYNMCDLLHDTRCIFDQLYFCFVSEIHSAGISIILWDQCSSQYMYNYMLLVSMKVCCIKSLNMLSKILLYKFCLHMHKLSKTI